MRLLAAFLLTVSSVLGAPERPNVLWISCEDTGPHLGCYGDPLARTPRLDALAGESTRYTKAFAYTGVCAPSRSCLITGVLPLRLGSEHMRSNTPLPKPVHCFPTYLREAGYYCTNNSKEDYNFKTPADAWDNSGRKAHWRGRKKGQPFFAVFNFTICHQSKIFCSDEKAAQNARRLTPDQRHDAETFPVPPIHPDTPEFRKEWARHYDNVSAMDHLVGDVLDQLEEDGLADNTIVVFFSDHGTGMPGVKMFAWEPSLRVPLLVRVPEKWKAWAPSAPGKTSDRMVHFVDFAPTVLSLTGLEIPAHMQGRAFLGPKAGEPRTQLYGGKGRQAECFDLVRWIHDGRFQYNRNFLPHLPFGQPMSYPEQHPSWHAWKKLHHAGKLEGAQARFFAPTKPVEELYDCEKDPWNLHNLATDPAYADDLQRLRTRLRETMIANHDLGLLSEYEIHRRSKGATPFALATDPKGNPIDALWEAAALANQATAESLPALRKLLAHPDPALRRWGALGLLTLGLDVVPGMFADLRKLLTDDSPEVRVIAAETLAQGGKLKPSLPVLEAVLSHPSPFIRLEALQAIQRIGPPAKSLIPAIRQCSTKDATHRHAASYVGRMVGYLPGKLRGESAPIH